MNILNIDKYYPFIIFIYLCSKSVISNNYKFLIAYIINSCSNIVLKDFIFKPIMGDKKYPIIGIGKRPDESKNCDMFIDYKSYGMPSGHAQIISFFLVYELLSNNNKYYKIILTIVSIYMIYSRVKVKCHTGQQVVMGSLIGAFFTYLYKIYII